MSEVEKLYKNAGVEKQYDYTVIKKNYNGKIGYTKRAVLEKVEQFKNKTLRIIEVCPFYPDFTAEKQLELICWLVNNKDSIMITNKPKPINLEVLKESIAYGINLLWQDLTEQDRTEIRSILNGI